MFNTLTTLNFDLPSQQHILQSESMYTVKVASLAEFENHKEQWNALVHSMRYPSIFASWEWIRTWWQHFARDTELVNLFIYTHSSNELVGILPLFLQHTHLNKDWHSGRVLQYAGSSHLYPDHLDIICAEQNAQACLQAVFDFLFDTAQQQPWDILYLPYLADNSCLLNWLTNTTNLPIKFNIQQTSAAPYIVMTDTTFEQYMERFNSKQRYNIRSRQKKLNSQHNVQYLSCKPDDLHKGLDILFALHAHRADQKDIESSFRSESIIDFHHDLLAQMAATTWPQIKLLKNECTPFAALYGFTFARRFFFYQIAHDPEWTRLGPGKVILYNAIKQAFTDGYQEYNFLQGEESYKYQWTEQERKIYAVTLYNDTLRGKASRVGLHSKKILKRIIRDKATV